MSKAFLEQKAMTNATNPVHIQENELAKHVVFPTHWHDDIEILRFLRGRTIVQCGSNFFVAEKDCLAIITPNTIHSFAATDQICAYNCLQINNTFLEENGIILSNTVFMKPIFNQDLLRRFDDMKRTKFEDKSQYSDLLLKSDSLSFIIRLIQQEASLYSVSAYGNRNMQLVKDIINFIKSNLDRPLTADEVCSNFKYSKSYICRIIKLYTQHTITENINLIRCQQARQMLRHEDCTVRECAERCGFENLSYFTRTYSRYMNELPSTTKNKIN